MVVKTYNSFVANQLAEKADLFEEKDKEYSDNYLRAGAVMKHMFPGGLELINAEDFNRFALINQIINKIMRYSSHFKKGGHTDSLDDLAVYAMMTKESDAYFARKREEDQLKKAR